MQPVGGPAARRLRHGAPQLPRRWIQTLCRNLQAQGEDKAILNTIYISTFFYIYRFFPSIGHFQ